MSDLILFFTLLGKSRARTQNVKYGLNTFIIWLISLVLASPICIYQDVVEYGIKGIITYDKCLEDWPKNVKTIYSFIILIAQLLIPNGVMLFSHYQIQKHLNLNRFTKRKASILINPTKGGPATAQAEE